MIVAYTRWRRSAEHDAVRRLQLGDFHVSTRIEFDLDVFEMRFVIGSGVESDDLHQPVCRRISSEKQGDVIWGGPTE